MSFGKSSKKSSTNQESQTDPWEPTIPYLKQFLVDLDATKSTRGPTDQQVTAFETLKNRAAGGHPWLTDIGNLTSDTLGTTSRSPMVEDAYTTLQGQIGSYADGSNLDFDNNPYVQQMLAQVGDDVQNRVRGVFAGAGRDVAGNAAGLRALGKGITEAQTPILAQLYESGQNRQIDAAKSLYGAGSSTATTAQALDKDALATRAGGIDVANAFLTARDLPENTILNLEQQMKDMSIEDLSLYAQLIAQAAGLGSQQTGTSTTKSRGTTFGLSL